MGCTRFGSRALDMVLLLLYSKGKVSYCFFCIAWSDRELGLFLFTMISHYAHDSVHVRLSRLSLFSPIPLAPPRHYWVVRAEVQEA